MTDTWKDLEGVTLAEKFWLQNLLFENWPSACFLARIATGSRCSGWLRLVLADGATDVRQLELWQIAAGLSHPNLAQVWETGSAERGITSMVYLLTEAADEDLAAVLRERPLDQVEARETLLSAAKALSYLHSRALVHGKVEPAAILAVGDHIKLSSDTIAPSVESGDGVLSAADDLRALGDCVHAMFTQSRDTDLEHLCSIPQPFRDIIRGCYGVNQNEEWTAQRIVATLDLPSVAAVSAADDPALEWVPPRVPPPPPPTNRKRISAWVFAPAGVGAALLVILLARKPQPATPPPTLPAGGSRVVRVPNPTAPPALPSALSPPVRQSSPKASDVAQSRIWRVISYTYSKTEDAARMVREINRKWPHLRAELFSPNGSGPPYFVALGGRMTRSEALRLQQRAISSGLPPDTFARNFRK